MDSRCGKTKMPYLRGGKRTSNAIAKQESPIAHGWAYEYNTEYSGIGQFVILWKEDRWRIEMNSATRRCEYGLSIVKEAQL